MEKVLFVHDGPIYKSGAGNYFGIDYNTNLKNRYLYLGDKVTFMTRVERLRDDMNLSKIEGADFDVISVPNFKTLTNYFPLKKQASKVIKTTVEEHDLLVIRLPSSIGILSWKYAIQFGKPYILELVACPWDGYMNHSLLGKIIAPQMYLKTQKIVKESSYVIYVSSEFLQRRYPTKGKELSCSDVTLPYINKDILIKRLEKIEKRKKEDSLILGTVGAVNMKYKGQQYVIKSIKHLIEEGYNVEYQLVGGGDNSYLKRLAKKLGVEKNVKFLGTLSHDKVLDFMNQIDIYIQPSNVESHGRVIIEAFSTACPVIGSSTGGIPELVDENYIFIRKNVKDLVSKIKKMMNSDLAMISQKNFLKAKTFEQEKLNRNRNAFYDELLNQEG
ncbi:glycosyltransferase [Fictibacillus norfolkensis]|uniref:Glycosyltransferase n=1 Tax=Fictibacillus norfolkensis TaxID=2762233 RepID=A0ABR8SN40_9BACL|nr:glycosyltransferase [Fictibacillus norfolkensis]MBD7964913.1 glycosyltransferase [Fictibacillus norfolkensis]